MKKIYSRDDVIDKLVDKNFLSYVVTPWHAIGLDILLQDFYNQKILLNGYIVITAATVNSDRFLISEKDFTNLHLHNIEVVYAYLSYNNSLVKSFFEELVYSIKKDNDNAKESFYLIRSLRPDFASGKIIEEKYNKLIKYHVIDEGLGTYISSQAIITKENFFNAIKYKMKLLILSVGLKRKKNIQWDVLYLKKSGKLIKNTRVVSLYRTYFSKFERDENNELSDAIIIITQPFRELKQVKNDSEIIVLMELVEYLKNKYNYRIVIKPHPRENGIEKYEKLGIEVLLNHEKSVEMIVASTKNKPKAVIGFTTTSLVSLSLLWNINTFSVNGYLPKSCMDNSLKFVVEQFNRYFKDEVRVICDYTEIEI